jgi:hypothetical protein
MDNALEKKMSAPKPDEPEARGEILDMDDSYTPEEEKAVLRKIDMVILPFVSDGIAIKCLHDSQSLQMCFVFFLQYLDKQSLSYAAVFGLIDDLNLTSSQYSWCSSIFYVGQLVAEYPCIYLMSRLHLTKFVGVTVYVHPSTYSVLTDNQQYRLGHHLHVSRSTSQLRRFRRRSFPSWL